LGKEKPKLSVTENLGYIFLKNKKRQLDFFKNLSGFLFDDN